MDRDFSIMAVFGADCGLSTSRYQSHNSSMRQRARIAKLGIFAATIVAAAGISCETDAWAADVIPTTVSTTAGSAPKPCTGLWDFVATNCQLTWHGITVYGTIDVGGGWQSHGAPFDPLSASGVSYKIRRSNRSSLWGPRTQRVEPIEHRGQRD